MCDEMKTKGKVLLRNSILGWMLIPADESAAPFMKELYGENWHEIRPSQRSFLSGEKIQTAMRHVKTICKKLKISISFCGKKAGPTIYYWK